MGAVAAGGARAEASTSARMRELQARQRELQAKMEAASSHAPSQRPQRMPAQHPPSRRDGGASSSIYQELGANVPVQIPWSSSAGAVKASARGAASPGRGAPTAG